MHVPLEAQPHHGLLQALVVGTLRLAASQPIDGRWFERVLEVNPRATAALSQSAPRDPPSLPTPRRQT